MVTVFHVERYEMSRAIAICNQKGGVGKSTTAINIGSYLALSGRRTLLIDLDPQGNASTACGIDRRNLEHDLYTVLVEGSSAEQAIQQTPVEGLQILPASLDLAGAEAKLREIDQREMLLRRLVEPMRETYDFMLFDCPPS